MTDGCTIRIGSQHGVGFVATTKEELIDLVRDLDEGGVAEVLDYVRWLLSEEDEPPTEDERAEVERAEAEMAAGDYVTLDELERKLGL
jgi:hypothetical protein